MFETSKSDHQQHFSRRKDFGGIARGQLRVKDSTHGGKDRAEPTRREDSELGGGDEEKKSMFYVRRE